MSTVLRNDVMVSNPDRLTLTIYTNQDNFSFSLYDPIEEGSYFYEELPVVEQTDAFDVFKEAFFNSKFFSLPFEDVLIMNRTPCFTYIPDSIHKGKQSEDYMNLLFPERQGITLHHTIYHTGINVLYQLPEDMYSFMNRSFPKPEFIHYSAPMINYFLKKAKNTDNSRRMIANLHKNGIDIFCFSEDLFLLGNYFRCNSMQEALYYILFVWKQLQFDQLNDSLYITGNTILSEELVENLASYLQKIYFMENPLSNHFEGFEAGKIPFELTALYSCGL